MNKEPPTLEELISPDLPEDSSPQQFSLVVQAAETAKVQSEMRDFLSLTIGNLFAFFALLFPPIIAKIVDIQADSIRQDEHNSETNDPELKD